MIDMLSRKSSAVMLVHKRTMKFVTNKESDQDKQRNIFSSFNKRSGACTPIMRKDSREEFKFCK